MFEELDPARGREAFARYLKPRLMELLTAIGLDVVYERGERDTLYYRDAKGEEHAVLDLLGGYGASLLGHNHPRIAAAARAVIEQKRPFHAQASARSFAGHLGERLSKIVGRATGREYAVTFANSGTEAVEAAIKHAEIEMANRIDAIHDRMRRLRKEVRLRLRAHTAWIPEELYVLAARYFDVPRLDDMDEIFMRIMRHNIDVLAQEPKFLAIENAFHGKSTGSLKLTNNPTYRSPWRRIGLRAAFLPSGDVDAIWRELASARTRYILLELAEDGRLTVQERSFTNISACFVEPIQGEGGIRELPADYLRALRSAADEGGFPLVIDEIQSGMGRAGTFLASEPSGVRGDYYLLSKALGGGFAKLSALLVDRRRYAEEYGYLHTSTFADDDFSSAVGLAVLDVIEEERVLERCRETGDHLLARLRELAHRFPLVVKDVRGRGLMCGIELARDVHSRAPLIRVLSEQNLLGFFVTGWLLRERAIRVAPALSAHGTIRLEPSAFLSRAEIDRFIQALECVCSVLEAADSFQLARFVVGRAGEGGSIASPAARDGPDFTRPEYHPSPYARKVAFLGHFLEPTDLKDWDRGLGPLSAEECDRFLEKTKGLLEPFIVERKELRSITGELVNMTVIGCAFTAVQAAEAIRGGDRAWIVEIIEKAVGLAKRLGCSIVGFGGFTSIVTDNCTAIVEEDVALTSGNSLAAVAGLEALENAARRAGIERPRLAVLGATGNIGAALAEVAADHLPEIVLVGRPGSRKRLERVAGEVYFGAWKRLTRQGATDGVAGAIAATETLRRLRPDDVARIGEAIRVGLAEELGERAPVRVSEDLATVRECNLVITATNAARPVLLPEHLGRGPVVVCDVAAPRDVDPRVLREREDVIVLKGGLVKAPLGQRLAVGGMRLDEGQLYGCLAETLLLGLSGSGENFSYGRLTASHLRRIRELARLHGFTIEEHAEDRGR
jgi:acetylornithine/succinyldiaminopimelate/putrescine aminotransferase/predicted amino acid dehydrogenase